MDKILIVQVAALGYDFLMKQSKGSNLCGLDWKPIQSVFPAVTCTAQASFRTASAPSQHGMVGNGFFSRELARPLFWEQSSSLVSGPRIWDRFREAGADVGMLFWQQSLGRDADLIVSPAPIHKHHGGMIQDCFSRPSDLYRDLVDAVGKPFDLASYWGPRSSVRSTLWIEAAARHVMKTHGTRLLLTYLPHLDYELQKSGPGSPGAAEAFVNLKESLERLLNTAREHGYKTLLFGDYAMFPVSRTVFPNRILKAKGLFSPRRIGRMTYPDLHTSRAFAVADHQAAHIIVQDPKDIDEVREIFENTEGVDEVLDSEGKKRMGIDHPRSGDLVLVAEHDAWFAYPWWDDKREAPDYASHIDIHNKPGYDPCELFFGWLPFFISTDTSKIKGSHGRIGHDAPASWATDLDLGGEPGSLVDLADSLKTFLERSD